MGNLQRMVWMVLFIVPFNLLCVAIFWGFMAGGMDQELVWKTAIGWAHLVMACWLTACGLTSRLLLQQPRVGRSGQVLQVVVPFSGLVFASALALTDQLVTPNISPFLLGSVFVSAAFLIRPALALGMYLVTYVLFYVGIGFTQPDAVQLLTNRLNGFSAVVFGFVLSLLLWRKNTLYLLLQRELERRNAALVQQREELLWLAKRDGLTGLFNRGEFLAIAEAELLRAQRHSTDTSAIMADLDFFKAVNDQHGHPAGDKVLKHAAAWLLSGVRATDTVARIGGEEFVVLLPRTAQTAALALAEKLLRLLHQSPAKIGSDMEVWITASLGVGTLPAGQEGSVAALYAAADHALYEAKRLGRNRVERTEPDPSLTPSDFQRLRRD